MKNIIFTLLFSLIINYSHAAKIAVIIAIGDYPKKGDWTSISSENDVPLIKNTLLNQGFLNDNIYLIQDKKATKKGILKLLSKIKSNLQEGDILMIHVSSHGQQIADQNGDEIDDMDEAIVPYDADAYFTEGKYEGENHLRDDELNVIFNEFRNKLGKKGQLVVTFDSCHSGSATRGKVRGGKPVFAPKDWKPEKNGKENASDMMEKVALSENASPFIFISGASANELNYEYKGNGSLSYAISKAFNELGKGFSYRQLFAKISSIMAVVSSNQTPTIEGDLDYEIFSGDYVEQQSYFSLKEIENDRKIVINGGNINRLFPGTKIFLTASTALKPTEETILSRGKIKETTNTTATITLENPLKSTNSAEYSVFIDEYVFDQIKVNVYLDSLLTATDKEAIDTKFKNETFVDLVAKNANPQLYITKENGSFSIKDATNHTLIKNNLEVYEIDPIIFTYAQGSYLKNLHMSNNEYQLDIDLLKLDENKKLVQNNGVMPVFNTKGDEARLKVTNNGARPVYFSVIELNTQGEFVPFIPSKKCPYTNDERKIAPGKSIVLRDCKVTFGPPYEKIILKAFAGSTPIDFNTLSSRGPKNPLEGIVKRSGSRGSETESADVEGYTTEFVYEIKD
ncbi:caspase family protein [Polaribacter sp.]|uniref:caspase family protein n=1 Tax=Polaribacter sp. TaxID=1920175 RepID=UPI003EF9F981